VTASATGIGVDIGGSHIVCAGVDLQSGRLIEGTRFAAKLDRKAAREELLEAWTAPIRRVSRALNGRHPVGVGFAMPGAFDYREGVALFSGNDKYENLYRADVRSALAERLGREPHQLRFINDATAFGIGTARLRDADRPERLIAVTLGTGFGSTFNEGGLPVIERADVPPHGSLWHQSFRDGIADDYFSTRWFRTTYRERTGREEPGVREIAARAGADTIARELFTEAGGNMAEFLAPWIGRFAADRLVVGGNIARAWSLMEAGFRSALGGEFPDLTIAATTETEDAAIVGGALLLKDTFWQRIKDDLPRK
jgi:glucokinase